MNLPEIPRQHKGHLRWNGDAGEWVWTSTGPYFDVVSLKSGGYLVRRLVVSLDMTNEAGSVALEKSHSAEDQSSKQFKDNA